MLGLPEITIHSFPYIAVTLFCLILILRGLEYFKSGKQTQANFQKYHPYVVQWLIKHNLGFLVPLMNLIGISQFTAPTNKKERVANIIFILVSIVALFLFMSGAELYYGHGGFILLVLAATMTAPFLDTLLTFTCQDGESSETNQNFGRGTILVVFLAAACVNIFSTVGGTGILIGSILHVIIVIGLVLLDYFITFKKMKNYRGCLSSMHHTMGYVLGFAFSFLILGLACTKSDMISPSTPANNNNIGITSGSQL